MDSLFTNEHEILNAKICDRGFCTFPLLQDEQVNYLLNFYKEKTISSLPGFHPTMFHNDYKYRKTVNDVITTVFKTSLKNYVSDEYEILYGNFMVKEPGIDSAMKIHQDWAYVDETKYSSFAFWIPLCDLTFENGAFNAIPFSHNIKNPIRGVGTFCPFDEHQKILKEQYSEALYLKAGEAVCWNHKLAHYSPPNLTDIPRVAVTVIVVPKEAELLHFFKSDFDNILQKYKIDKDFFLDYKIGESPNLSPTEKSNYTPVLYSKTDIIELLKPYKIKEIFKDKFSNENFAKDGFIIVDLLNPNEFNDLVDLYYTFFNKYQSTQSSVKAEYDLSFFRSNDELKKQIFKEMWSFFEQKISKYLPDYEPLIVNMFNKKPKGGEVPIHQNWTFVDENYHTSVSVWIPLCDVNRTNGTLEVVPGSHVNTSKYRGPSIPWAFTGIEEVLKKKHMHPLELTKGQVAIIDDAVIHYSSDNFSDYERPTIQLILKPKKAKAIHYHTNNLEKGIMDVYEVSPDFFMRFDMNSDEINAPLINTIAINIPKISELELI